MHLRDEKSGLEGLSGLERTRVSYILHQEGLPDKRSSPSLAPFTVSGLCQDFTKQDSQKPRTFPVALRDVGDD